MEHIERAGVNSGDSIAVYPAQWNLNGELIEQLIAYSRNLALALQTRGLVNIQYVIHASEDLRHRGQPRSSRTIPHISKVPAYHGRPATRAMLGGEARDTAMAPGCYKVRAPCGGHQCAHLLLWLTDVTPSWARR